MTTVFDNRCPPRRAHEPDRVTGKVLRVLSAELARKFGLDDA
ncbi:hypothetical protein R3Q06_30100 [Rhodococcus erythropolis]|nr:hypothetical protein [Rhodococcus erythropolis]MDV6277751.1 hypothetical protein [Rhodococcus erythropolis]